MIKLAGILIILAFLSSCWTKQDDNINPPLYEWDNSNLIINKSPEKTPEEIKKIIDTLESENEKELLLSFYNNWDTNSQKKSELLEDINKIIESKEKQIKELEEKWEKKTTREIKKELKIFFMITREK